MWIHHDPFPQKQLGPPASPASRPSEPPPLFQPNISGKGFVVKSGMQNSVMSEKNVQLMCDFETHGIGAAACAVLGSGRTWMFVGRRPLKRLLPFKR